MKVQQAQVSLDIINDTSDNVMMPEKNGIFRFSQVSELVIYTQVSGRSSIPLLDCLTTLKGS